MTVNWLEGSVTVIHFPWVDLRFPPPSTPASPETSTLHRTPHFCVISHRFTPWTSSTSSDYIASTLIVASSSLFILWQHTIKPVSSEEMKCQCELQAYAETGRKSAGGAEKVFLANCSYPTWGRRHPVSVR